MTPMEEVGRFAETPIELKAEMGRRRMRVKEILELKAGNLLILPSGSAGKVELFAADVPFARGELMARGGKLKIRITEWGHAA